MFSYHGGKDDKLPVQNAKATYEYMKNEIYTDDYSKNYTFEVDDAMGHAVSAKEVVKVNKWLVQIGKDKESGVKLKIAE